VDEHLKQRLVGASVLVALAVIFLPSFFQKTERVEINTRSQIPEAPSIEPIVINKPIKPAGVVVPAASELFQPAPQPLENTEVIENIMPLVKQATINSVVETPKTDARLNSQGVPLGWVLQVASFKSKASAENFVATLSIGNDKAYFKSAKTSQGQFYRVYVGPLIDKKQAEARQQEIDKIHKVKSQLLRFNPISGN
jgi:DedD protein